MSENLDNNSFESEKQNFEARQNIAGFFGLSLKVDIKVKLSFSIYKRKKQSKHEYLWKLAKLLLLLLQVFSIFIK